MKVLSREFTRMEKILIVGLIIILLGLGYYRFIYLESENAIRSAKSEEEMIQQELDSAEEKLTYLQSMQSSMDELKESGNLSWMGSYNNSPSELKFLNDILSDTKSYSISFADVSRSGDQIRRSFTLQYTTADYEEAQEIMKGLSKGEIRCLIGDVSCTINADGSVGMSQSATFYETMVGGVADAALPADSADVNS